MKLSTNCLQMMICAKCHIHFCWVCMKCNATYGHFCGGFSYSKDQEKHLSDKELATLRYDHYAKKFASHSNAVKAEKTQRLNLQAKLSKLENIDDLKRLINSSAEVLFACRRVLAQSYIFAFFKFDMVKTRLKDHKKEAKFKDHKNEVKQLEIYQNLFESHLETIEMKTEKLSHLLSRDIQQIQKQKFEIQSTAQGLKKFVPSLLDVIEKQEMNDFPI